VQRLLPDPTTAFDLMELFERGERVPPPSRPWVMANMVSSADGAFSLDGRSAGLGGPADRAVFRILRAAADAILATAGTARSERYRRPIIEGDLLEARHDAGLTDSPRLVLVSRSLALPDDLPLLSGPGPAPLVFHPQHSDTSRVPRGVELRAEGAEDVDLGAALGQLRRDGVEQLLCEGGPDLLGQLVQQDLVDELFLTISPMLAGGDDVGLLGDTPEEARAMHLHRALEDDGFLFLTYRLA
jgi:riboflavin biosynthesis pyrimidine reductase